MKRTLSIVLLNVLLATGAIAQELTPDCLIQKHLSALGPEELMEEAVLCETKGELQVSSLGQKQKFLFRNIAFRDGKRYSEIQNAVGGTLSRTFWNGQQAWKIERGEEQVLQGPAKNRIKHRPFISPFTDTTYYKGQLIGLKEMQDKIVLTVKDPNGELHTYNFDPKTYLITGEIYRDDLGILNMVEYKDYREMAGLQFPEVTHITRFIDTGTGSPEQRELLKVLREVRLFESQGKLAGLFDRPD